MATVIDLARRKFITMREESELVKRFWGSKIKTEYFWDLNRDYWDESGSEMLDYESELLEFLFNKFVYDFIW